MSLLKSAVGLSAAAILTLAGALPASAAVRTHAPTAGAHVRIKAVPTSNIGAGYFAYPGTPNVSSASAQFTIPAVSCNSVRDNEGVFPGIWIYDDSGALMQQVDVNLYCLSGEVHMLGVICIAGSSAGCVTNLVVHPGDRIVATFSESPFHTQGQLYNLTTHTSDSIYDGTPAPTSDYSVFIGDAGPGPFGFSTKIPVFDHIRFSKCQVDGYYLFEYSATATSLKTARTLQIKTSPLQQDGDAFTTTFVHT